MWYLQGLVTGLMLMSGGMLVMASLVGLCGGLREVRPTAEDEVLVNYVKRSAQ